MIIAMQNYILLSNKRGLRLFDVLIVLDYIIDKLKSKNILGKSKKYDKKFINKISKALEKEEEIYDVNSIISLINKKMNTELTVFEYEIFSEIENVVVDKKYYDFFQKNIRSKIIQAFIKNLVNGKRTNSIILRKKYSFKDTYGLAIEDFFIEFENQMEKILNYNDFEIFFTYENNEQSIYISSFYCECEE